MEIYRGMTFCSAGGTTCSNKLCHRYVKEETKADAEASGLPIRMWDISRDCDFKIPFGARICIDCSVLAAAPGDVRCEECGSAVLHFQDTEEDNG